MFNGRRSESSNEERPDDEDGGSEVGSGEKYEWSHSDIGQ